MHFRQEIFKTIIYKTELQRKKEGSGKFQGDAKILLPT